jgi:RNA polymerase sigma-70 factor (ECF subfamily)
MEQLFRLAYARIGNLQDAEDVVQETYLKAWRSFDTVKQRENVKGWITQILINSIRDHHRKEQRRVPTIKISEIDEEALPASARLGPEQELCRDEIDPLLFKALCSIPESFLTPLLLREIHGSTYDEIAQTLGVPIGTVMSRLFRARSLLRSALLPDDLKQGSSK